jgi:hypothetical protein
MTMVESVTWQWEKATAPYVALGAARLFGTTGVPEGHYVGILKQGKYRPLLYGERIKAGDVIALCRIDTTPVTIKLEYKRTGGFKK